jgi:hypothetical protein
MSFFNLKNETKTIDGILALKIDLPLLGSGPVKLVVVGLFH